MAIVKMSEMTCIALLEERCDVLKSLQNESVLEIRELPPEKIGEMVSDSFLLENAEKRQACLTARLRIQKNLRDISQCFPDLKKERPSLTLEQLLAAENREAACLALMDEYENIKDSQRKYQQEEEQLLLEQALLAPWKDLSLQLEKRETERCLVFAGSLPSAEKLQELREKLDEEAPETAVELLRDSGQGCQIILLSLKEHQTRVRSLLSAAAFIPLPVKVGKREANEIWQANQRRLSELKSEGETALQKRRTLAEGADDLERLYDFYGLRLERLQAEEQLERTDSAFALRGWVPADKGEALMTLLKEHFICHLSLRAAKEGEETPILLKNGPFSRAYEIIVEMFGAPDNQEADPTAILAPFYFMIFGMMLSDVGYGLLLTGLCFWLLRSGKMKSEGERMCRMLFVSGISSIAWGFVFGGFFGNLVSRLSEGRFHFPCLWFDPMDDPMKLMIFSMLFGLIHLFFGMGMDIYNKFRHGEGFAAMTTIFPWYFLILGLILMLSASALALPPFLALAGKIMAGGAALVLVFFGGAPSRNPFVRLGKGLLSLYGITGYLSDVLSYSRILALVLATSVIALVVNELGFILGPTIPGILIFIIIGGFGHALNLALSALSAYVHTCRLQYVEFFGKFYTGGGRLFRPLSNRTEYTRLKKKAGGSL